MSQKRKLFQIDPHSIVRSGLRLLVSNEPAINFVGEADSGRAAWPLLEQCQPDLVVMELLYPQEDGLELLRRLRLHKPGCHVLIFTDNTDEQAIGRAIYSGAIGYLPKSVPSPEIIQAVHAVAHGEPALHTIAQRVVLQLARSAPTPPSALTTREQEILRLITQGKRNRDIANQLCLTEGTVKGYVSTILNKLEVDDRTQAAMFAVKHRLVPNL
jgi:two-component system, NarL family, response regulator LiaR